MTPLILFSLYGHFHTQSPQYSHPISPFTLTICIHLHRVVQVPYVSLVQDFPTPLIYLTQTQNHPVILFHPLITLFHPLSTLFTFVPFFSLAPYTLSKAISILKITLTAYPITLSPYFPVSSPHIHYIYVPLPLTPMYTPTFPINISSPSKPLSPRLPNFYPLVTLSLLFTPYSPYIYLPLPGLTSTYTPTFPTNASSPLSPPITLVTPFPFFIHPYLLCSHSIHPPCPRLPSPLGSGGKMAESNECFNIGSTVNCKTCFNEDLQGEVVAFDPHVKLLTLSIL